jgi:hypothetical protein
VSPRSRSEWRPARAFRKIRAYSTRRTSTATGVVLVLATIAALGAAALDPTLTGTGYLTAVANHPNRLAVSALLYLVAAGTSVGIAIALYPLLRKLNAGLALGAVVFRAIEAVLYTTAVVSLLSLMPLAQHFAAGPGDSLAPIQAIADSLLSIRDHATLAAVFAFNVGALSYYALFYRSRLVPRWLSGWGMAGVVLLMTACLLALFSDNPVTGYTLLILPIALHEMALAVWLLVKGFGPASHPSSSAREESTARGQLLPPTARPKPASTASPTSVTMWS